MAARIKQVVYGHNYHNDKLVAELAKEYHVQIKQCLPKTEFADQLRVALTNNMVSDTD